MARTSPASAGSHTVRIVGGRWRRSRLPVADLPGLRPTPDRVRETVFNWLGQDLTGWRCVDAFAGTGALGFEAASRGAGDVLLVEQDRGLARQLEHVRQRLRADRVRVQCGDGVAAVRALGAASVDLVFLDPPFGFDRLASVLRGAAAAIGPAGWVYLETPQRWSDEALAPSGLVVHRHLAAGMVHAHLLCRPREVPAGEVPARETQRA